MAEKVQAMAPAPQRGSAATDCGFRIAEFGLVVPKIFARRKDFRK
jgi:hypothetical protein